VNALEEIIAARIAAEGPIDFASFMELALYRPELGYYSAGERRTGWRGDFVTSPELDRAYGELWGRAFEQIWDACGSPHSFDVIEVGPGEGSFAASVLESVSGAFADALHYTLVERVPEVSRRQRTALSRHDRVTWTESLADVTGNSAGCVFANEVVDNLPVRLIERRGATVDELCVGVADARFDFVRRPAPVELVDTLYSWGVELPDGHRAEVPVAATRFAAAAAGCLRRGAVVIVDYGDDAESLITRPEGTLVSYSSRGADDLVLERPGEKDITAHVNWTALRAAFVEAGARMVGPESQRVVLKRLGADRITEGLREEAEGALEAGAGVRAFRALARRGAMGALTDPRGLGGFGVVVAVKDMAEPRWVRKQEPL
jgi:SAM-dependent MidA family methyltransferase